METEVIDSLDKGGGALRTIKDLAAGAAGGMAQVLLGMCAPYPTLFEFRGKAMDTMR